MSNILRARQNLPLGWFYAWTPLNEDSIPNITHTTALNHPETIKVHWEDTIVTSVDDKGTKTTKQSDKQADVIPDKGIFGCKFAMIHTFLDFDSSIKSRLNNKDPKYVEYLYTLMGKCFQGNALTKWTKAVSKVDEASRSVDTFLQAQHDYLEAVAGVKNLVDCLIRQLCDRAKPAAMSFDDYVDRRDEWKRHVEGPFLRKTFNMPTKEDWAEQIFTQQPKTHQSKYTEKFEEVETDVE